MTILLQATTVDWQAIVVFALLLGAIVYLVSLTRSKKSKSCGSGQCGCVKKNGDLPLPSKKSKGRSATDHS
ncbi:hypothetical protein AAFN60_06690 [Roseibacillus persicicus]|uniref:hypothetical protein n=1 Tax=Roseibacillus persicicus TaxID=454148 RepID=UPI00398B682D